MISAYTLLNNKTHIIYVTVIAALLLVSYFLLSRKPKEIIKTEVVTKIETKVVTKDVIKTQKVYVDRIKEIKKSNGDIITETTHSYSDNEIKDNSKSKNYTKDVVSKQEVIKFLSNYTLDVMYPMTVKNMYSPVFNPLDLQALVGVRLFGTPFFITAGTDGHFNKILVGARVEF